uniref:Right handed beta helix domain-containing protein n=1 Tax=Ignisphaera aggregans TaxID=334771 RepID=A0A7C4FGW0_9CREN
MYRSGVYLSKKISIMCAAILVMVLVLSWALHDMSAALGQTYVTIYIRPDGSVEPLNAPITTSDKRYYKLTSDLVGGIVIERSGIVVDGGGHALTGRVRQGSMDIGLLVLASNVLITGFRLHDFSEALIILNATSVEVSKCTVVGNWEGVHIISSTNVLVHNNIMKDNAPSIRLDNSTYVEASENDIDGNGAGVIVISSSSAYIHENAIRSRRGGIIVESSDMVYIGGNTVEAPNEIGISVMNSTRTYIFNNSLDGGDEAGSCNIRVAGSEKTVIHKNLLLNAPEAVVIDELANHTIISYNHVASENPHRTPSITLTGNSTAVVIYGNSGGLRVEPQSSHEVVIQNNTNVVIEGGASSMLAICANMHTSIELSDVHFVYICGNLVDAITVNGIVVRGTNIAVHGNTVKNHRRGEGIAVSGDLIKVYENEVTNNSHGVAISGSHFEVHSNNITHNNVGVLLFSGLARDGVVHDNFIAFNGGDYEPFCGDLGTGVCVYGSEVCNITFYHNSFVNNSLDNGKQVYITREGYKWDSGYPSGGNYWSDYTGVDVKKGVNQDEPGSDGIGDTPHQVSIYPGELDRYPLVKRPPHPSKSQLNLIPPPNIVIEPPQVRIATPTPTATARTTPITTSAPTATPSPTPTATVTTTFTSTPSTHTSAQQTTAPQTKTTQSASSTVSTTTATAPQRVFDATTLIVSGLVAVAVITVAILLLRKRVG